MIDFDPSTAIEVEEFDPGSATLVEEFDPSSATLAEEPKRSDEEIVAAARAGKGMPVLDALRIGAKRALAPYTQDGQEHPAYRNQTIGFGDASRAPVPKLPRAEAKGGTAEQIGRGLYNVFSDVVNALPTAEMASVITSPFSAAYVGANFLADAFINAPEAGRAVVDPNISTMDATSAVAGTLMMGVAPVAGLKPLAKSARSLVDAGKANLHAAEETIRYSEGQRALEEKFRQNSALEAQIVEMARLNKLADSAERFVEVNTLPGKTAEESAAVMGVIPTKSAAESARVLGPAMAANEARSQAFDLARAEEAATGLAERQAASPEQTTLTGTEASAKLYNLDTVRGEAMRERARLEKQVTGERMTIPEKELPPLSAQASRMMEDYGAINTKVLSALAQSSTGAAGGFAWGYYKGRDLPEKERVANALQWAIFGGLLPVAMRPVVSGAISRVHIPTGAARGLFAGAENFYLFPKAILKDVYDVMKGERTEVDALALNALKSYDALEAGMNKATAGDRVMVGNFLRGSGSAGNIFDPQLASAAQKVRAAVDDFTLDMKARGIIEAGSDLDATATNNLGAYLTRAYRVFEDPNYKPAPQDMAAFVTEYVKDALLNRSAKPIPELRQEGYETGLRMLAKGPGGALENAAQFALGNGIARTDGGIFMPRKALTDATRKLLGEIDDPVHAAGQTIDRMTHFLGARITQEKMRIIGTQLGLFSDKATETHTVPMTASGTAKSRGPLANLWTTPEVSNALKSDAAYHQNGLAWRALATATAYAKINKTVLNAVSYAPNAWSSAFTLMGQGSGVRIIMHPGELRNATRLVFDDVFPSTSARIQADAVYLTRERILRQNVNLNDMVENMRQSFTANIGASLAKKVPQAVAKAGKKTLSVALNAYGKAEELPRVLGFYLETRRYASALFEKSVDALTTAERAEVYDRSAKVVREVYPNPTEIPELVKKLSIAGIGNPFISWTYDTMWRNPYNTIRTAAADIKEGTLTGNRKLIAAGVNRASWFIGTVLGSIAVNEAMKQRNGVNQKQDEAIRRLVPEYDREGLLLIKELNPSEVAYANQSYLLPHSLPGAAINAALSGVSPTDAVLAFAKEFGSPFAGDGGLLIGPAIAAFTGKNEFGRQVFTEDAGKFLDTSKVGSRSMQDLSIGSQQAAERIGYFLSKTAVPGTVNEAIKWKRAMNDEVGPDGQLYKKGDLLNRLGGYRLSRIDIPTQYERKAVGIADRLRTIGTQFSPVRDAKMSTPEDIARAYETQEQARRRVASDIKTYLEDGVDMMQPRQKMIDNLRQGGVSSELVLGVLNGYYVPGKMGKDPTMQERVDALLAMPAAEREAKWAALMKDDPLSARAMIPTIKDQARGRTPEDKLLLGLNVNDGTRAKNIARILAIQPDKATRDAAYQAMKVGGFINGIVENQLMDPQIWAEAFSQTKK